MKLVTCGLGLLALYGVAVFSACGSDSSNMGGTGGQTGSTGTGGSSQGGSGGSGGGGSSGNWMCMNDVILPSNCQSFLDCLAKVCGDPTLDWPPCHGVGITYKTAGTGPAMDQLCSGLNSSDMLQNTFCPSLMSTISSMFPDACP